MKDTLIIKGFIRNQDNYDSGDGLRIDEEILSDSLTGLCGKQVSVSFYISDEEKSLDKLKENHILSISGALYADYGDAWSDYTGYLWTDDKLSIGNHDLIEDLLQHEGKYCLLEIKILQLKGG